MALARFLEKGEQEVDLKIRRDGDQITSLEFELPAPLRSTLFGIRERSIRTS